VLGEELLSCMVTIVNRSIVSLGQRDDYGNVVTNITARCIVSMSDSSNDRETFIGRGSSVFLALATKSKALTLAKVYLSVQKHVCLTRAEAEFAIHCNIDATMQLSAFLVKGFVLAVCLG
jgi:S-adenosylmethionine hydrolase